MFNEAKATQTAARLLRLAGGSMNYMVLIKLLYLADRDALLRWGRPITGDEYFTMKLGPVLSQVRDLITEQEPPEADRPWTRHIVRQGEWGVALHSDAGDDELSEAEEQLLDEVYRRFGKYTKDPFALPGWIHANLPEVKKVESGRIELPIEEILAAGGKSKEAIAAVVDELKLLDELDASLIHG